MIFAFIAARLPGAIGLGPIIAVAMSGWTIIDLLGPASKKRSRWCFTLVFCHSAMEFLKIFGKTFKNAVQKNAGKYIFILVNPALIWGYAR